MTATIIEHRLTTRGFTITQIGDDAAADVSLNTLTSLLSFHPEDVGKRIGFQVIRPEEIPAKIEEIKERHYHMVPPSDPGLRTYPSRDSSTPK